MAVAAVDEPTFIRLFEELGAHKTAERLGVGVRRVMDRRKRIEERTGRSLVSPNVTGFPTRFKVDHPGKIDLLVKDGVVLIGSDAHYWPGIVSAAHRAFLHFAKRLSPKAVILNGDVLDGARISRHPPIGWEKRPDLIEEIETCQMRLYEIQGAAPKAEWIWTLGNHDSRLETRIATVAPEFARVKGVHLRDHFPDFRPCWSVWINDAVVVKHRYKNGIHATHNNTIWSGKSMVTGHLHSLKVTPLTDYNGTRWGVDTGTMADPYGPQFLDYCEGSPVNWRSGFAVLTFRDSRLMWPELVHVIGPNEVEFRGEIVRV